MSTQHDHPTTPNYDGCTGVADIYVECCHNHDAHYWLGDITRAEADKEFRQCMQEMSPFGVFSPMSWWRWAAVRWLGQAGWDHHRRRDAAKAAKEQENV